MKIDVKQNLKHLMFYFLGYLGFLFYLETVLKLATKGRLTGQNFWMLCLLPAIALCMAALTGFFGAKANRILVSVTGGIFTVLYCSQLIYYKIFGSYWSFKMLGMGGAAVSNFSAAIMLALLQNLHFIVLLAAPFVVFLILSIKRIIKIPKVAMPYHIAALVIVVPLWMLGVLVLKFDGSDRASAYYIYSSELVDTDTTNGRFGSLSTLLIEAGLGKLNYGMRESTDAINEAADSMDEILDTIDEFGSLTPTLQPELTAAAVTDTPAPVATVTDTPAPVYPDSEDGCWAFDIDFDAIAAGTEDEDIQALCSYFSNIEPSEKNAYTGLFEGYNLIYICAESFWTYAANEAFTPTLYKLINNGIVLTNYYNSFLNTTTNGEFAFATGLWPDVSREYADNGADVGSFPQSADNYMPFGLGNIFNSLGVKSYAFHNYYGAYYSREKSWPNLGYACKFKSTSGSAADGMLFSSSWISSDLEMMEQSIDDYINDDTFHAYYMTFSGHGPYNLAENGGWGNDNVKKNYEEALEINKDYDYSEEALCYLSASMELDKALEYLLDRLEEAGKLDKTVIVLTGDHFPYYLSTSSVISELAGTEMTNDSIEHYKSSCIIYNSAIEEPIVCDTYCSNVDILPTILNLFNLPFDSRLLSGHDVFAENVVHKSVLYNLSFINEVVQYDATDGSAEWKIDDSLYDAETLDMYLYSMSALAESEYAAAIKLMDTDFYRIVFDYLNSVAE